jgi:hypothetical protein
MSSGQKFKCRISQGLCGFCGEAELISSSECERCQAERRERQRKEYVEHNKLEMHRNRWRKREKLGLCPRCGLDKPAECRKTCEGCLNKQRKYTKKLKDQVYAKYGGYVCACCGEDIVEFLTLDHVNNDGRKHREALGGVSKGSGKSLYKWIIDHDFPAMFQILCCNCNYGKKLNKGVCPHRKSS